MSSPLLPRHPQHGAALAVALLILIVLTGLGVVAVRSSVTALRIAQNAQTRLAAQQLAESVAEATIAKTTQNLPILPGTSYIGCYINAGSAVPANVPFTCATNTLVFPQSVNTGGLPLNYVYAQVTRNSPEFINTGGINGALTSSSAYNFASFTVTGGYDNSASGLGAAEVSEGVLRLHANIPGINYQ